jgi:hypothetical protein
MIPNKSDGLASTNSMPWDIADSLGFKGSNLDLHLWLIAIKVIAQLIERDG